MNTFIPAEIRQLKVCHPDVFLNIYKVQIFSVRHIQFIVKNTFKATCFGSTGPSSGLLVRTDPYPITSTTYNSTLSTVEYIHVILDTVEALHIYIQQHIQRRNMSIEYFTIILKLTTSTVI
jgi:hypothetical protein